ncbi:MAG TPA: response regulator transcription factor [Aeromonadales bacterium]|nr:response regulator transcription factor [Aeromonadales bacterium]
MKIIVVDDEPLARARLIKLLQKITDCNVVAEAENGLMALEKITQYQPDIVLLDIEMPGIDGIETAAQLQQRDHPPAIIFTTAYDQHALDAFQSGGQAYLLKPVNEKELINTILRVSKLTQLQLQEDGNALSSDKQNDVRDYISITIRGALKRIALEDIYYFKAEQKYVVIRYNEGEALTEEPLKSLEKEFEKTFIRTHRNSLVARDKITELRRSPKRTHHVFVKEIDQELEVSRRHVAKVRKMLKGL